MSTKTRRISLLTIRIILGLLFLLSGIGKLIEGSDARYLVELMATEFYWLIEYASPIVIIFSVLELAIAGLLLWGRKIVLALSAALTMLIGFNSVLGYFYLQGMNVENCGCFGALGIGGGLEATLLRNFVLMALVIAAYLLMPSKKETD